MRFLVTAGNTREKIDDVRDWGNIFSGNTGLKIARALTELGEVDLLTSNQQHLAELASDSPRLHGYGFVSHAELRAALQERVTQQQYSGIFMAAAVADYKPVRTFAVVEQKQLPDGRQQWVVEDVQAGKVRSTHPRIAVLAQPTEKLVDLFRNPWNYNGLLVKFKLEVGCSRQQLLEIARRSRLASQADYLVANTLDMVSGPEAGAYLVSAEGEQWIARDELAVRMLEIARHHHIQHPRQ
ncbi:MAG: hypothetical protein IT448_05000 [Phycisphaerales bacterium]|nr:hypothetical protein [Phycisphaerales bacterium]